MEDPLFILKDRKITAAERRLVSAFLSIEKPEIMHDFLKEIISSKELQNAFKKLDAAFLLSIQMPYDRINQSTGFGTATIAKVAKRLKNHKGGINYVLSKLYPFKFELYY